MGTREGAGVEKEEGRDGVNNSWEEEQPGKSWVVLEERNQGSIGLPLLLGLAKSHRHERWLPFFENFDESLKILFARKKERNSKVLT